MCCGVEEQFEVNSQLCTFASVVQTHLVNVLIFALQQGNEEIRLLQSLQDSSYGLNYVDLSMSRGILNTLSR